MVVPLTVVEFAFLVMLPPGAFLLPEICQTANPIIIKDVPCQWSRDECWVWMPLLKKSTTIAGTAD